MALLILGSKECNLIYRMHPLLLQVNWLLQDFKILIQTNHKEDWEILEILQNVLFA